jgi:homing endonuclease-like protein
VPNPRAIPPGRTASLIPLAHRFWLKVWPRGDCWEWRGGRSHDGYGRFRADTRAQVYAHRFAYIAAKGILASDLELDHLCRHRWCVKPSHLEATTHKTNVRRGECPAVQRQRHARARAERGAAA